MISQCIITDKAENCLFKLWNMTVLPFKREVREHSHTFFEIVIFKSGKGIYSTSEGCVEIQAGDIFIFPSGEQHCITEIESGEPFSFMNIHFEPSYVWSRGASGISGENIDVCFSGGRLIPGRLERGSALLCDITQKVQEIERECESKKPEFELMVHSLLYEILVKLLRENIRGEKPEYSKMQSVKKALVYIDGKLTEKMELPEIAARVGFSPNYFSAVFKSTMGITLWEYINKKRIELAIDMLTSGKEKNVLDIAIACGFNNTANFNKIFRKYTGLTPHEYRKNDSYLY